MTDDSGAYAEQGSSSSRMTAASVTDVIARPDCDGQAADAVSAYTQVKMEDAPKIAHNSQVGVSRCTDASSTT